MIRALPIFVFLGLLASGCHHEDVQLRPVDRVLQKIGGTWKPSDITLDGVSLISQFHDFGITFSGSDTTELIYFSTTPTPDHFPWPESGTMNVGPREEIDLIIDPDRPIVYALSESKLEFAMSFMSLPRTDPGSDSLILTKIVGSWVFTLTKE